MERREVILERNNAKAKEVEFSAEKQRLKLGFITLIRRPMIDRLYAKDPRKIQ